MITTPLKVQPRVYNSIQSGMPMSRKCGCLISCLYPIASTAAPRWFTEGFVDSHPDVVEALSNALAAGSSEGYASCCEALSVADTREQLKDIKVPVTVLAGSQDPVTTVADGQYMVDHIDGANLVTIDASHISNVEQPEVFTQLIRDYLTI